MMTLLLVALAVGTWQPAATPVGPAELTLARQLAAQPRRTDESADDADLRDAIPGRIVVGYRAECRAEAEAAIRSIGGQLVRSSISGGDFLVAEFPAQDQAGTRAPMQGLRKSPLVRYVEPEVRCHAFLVPDDPYYADHQWGNCVMYADQAWDLTIGVRDIKVAVVDQGIDYNHPDLSACFDPVQKGYDFVDRDADPLPVSSIEFHGSHVGGIIAAGINNSVGIAGWANVTLLSCRVLNDSGWGSFADVADGVRWAVDQGARIINMSLGGGRSSVMQDAVRYAWDHGVLMIAASGNDGGPTISYPAAFDECIAVGALDTDGRIAYFSNFGAQQELIAPGVNVVSTVPDSGYDYLDGTSMASPQVAGVAALVCSYRPGLSNREIRAILDAAAIDLGRAGSDQYYGFGLVNAWRALKLAELYGSDIEAVHALSQPWKAGSVVRVTNLSRSLAADCFLLDAQGRQIRPGQDRVRPGVYFVRSLKSGTTVRVVAVR